MRNLFPRSAPSRPVRLAGGGLILLLPLLLCLACRPRSPEEDLRKAVEPVGSWLATLQMTGQKWTANSVPASFVRSTTAAALKALDKVEEDVAGSGVRPSLQQPVLAGLAETRDAGRGLRRAAEAGDRKAMDREVRKVAALQARFETLIRSEEGGGQ